MIANLATIDEIKRDLAENGLVCLKYVRVRGEYRFLFVTANCAAHEQMVDEGERVQTAAYVKVYADSRVEIEGHSVSLKKYPHPSDENGIRRAIFGSGYEVT